MLTPIIETYYYTLNSFDIAGCFCLLTPQLSFDTAQALR